MTVGTPLRKRFKSDSFRTHNGKRFRVIETLPPTSEPNEIGLMFIIEVEGGIKIHAYAEEVLQLDA